MNNFQICYTVALLAMVYPAWNRQRYAMFVLVASLASTLFACLALDIEWLGRDDAIRTMMVIDITSGVALALRAGLPRIIALGYAVTVPVYWADLVYRVPTDTTWGILYVAAVAQLGVLSIGIIGNGGGGNRRRSVRRFPLAVSGGSQALSGGPVFRGVENVQGQ